MKNLATEINNNSLSNYEYLYHQTSPNDEASINTNRTIQSAHYTHLQKLNISSQLNEIQNPNLLTLLNFI